MWRPVRYVLIAGALLCLLATAASAGFAAGAGHRTYTTGSTRPLRTALFDPDGLKPSDPQAFVLTRSAGAQYVRLVAPWSSIAPAEPGTDFHAADPNSPGYSWHGLDATVGAAVAAGLKPILDITLTPGWAYAVRPEGVNQGTPRAAALGQFALALARHYDGENGLPVVSDFEVWNEPNLSLNLGPANASSYRAMVNAVAASVHAVDPNNLVVAGALDPFGQKKNKHQSWNTVAPLTFMRSLLCLSKGPRPHATCKDQIDFDVWSHHPYTFGGPFGTSKNPGDVELGNLSQMSALLRAAVKAHHVVSTHAVQFWVTEFGWDTNPPRKGAASMALASRWTAESLWQAWRSGVSLLTWFSLEDEPGSSAFKSGLYFYAASLEEARPKPVLTAFRFPFVAHLHRTNVSVWGRDATSITERVTIQLRHGRHGGWRTVAHIVANSSGIFQATLKLEASKKDWLRAVASGSGKSLAFSLTVPHAPHIGSFS